MESMIELDIHKNKILLSVKERDHKLFIYPCHKNLYDEDYSGWEIRLLTYNETELNTNCHFKLSQKKEWNNVKCLLKAKWRSQSNTLHEGKKSEKKKWRAIHSTY